MSDTWFAAFGLLTVLCLVNSVVLVGLLRQVGVLHERIAPNPPGAQVADEKLIAGTVLPKLDFTTISSSPLSDPFEGPLTLLGYVRPGCGVCLDLPPLFQAYGEGGGTSSVKSVLATDAPSDAAIKFLKDLGLENDGSLPLVQSPNLLAAYGIPGSPYVIAFQPTNDGELTVLSSGVVNTLEQLEILVEQAIVFRDRSEQHDHSNGDTPVDENQETSEDHAAPRADSFELSVTARGSDPQPTTNTGAN